MTAFIPSDFVQMASVKTFNYSSELRMTALELFCSEPSRIQTPKMIAVNIVRWIILGKISFCCPCEGCQVSVAGFSTTRHFRVGRNDVA